MAVEPLSDELKTAGAAMLRELDAIGLLPQGVLWLHFHALNDWRLTIISDLIDAVGRLKVYGLVDDALARHGPVDRLTIFDIHLASPEEVLPRVLGGNIRVKDGGGVELNNGTMNGALIDAYVYRLVAGRSHDESRAAAKTFEKQVKRLTLAS